MVSKKNGSTTTTTTTASVHMRPTFSCCASLRIFLYVCIDNNNNNNNSSLSQAFITGAIVWESPDKQCPKEQQRPNVPFALLFYENVCLHFYNRILGTSQTWSIVAEWNTLHALQMQSLFSQQAYIVHNTTFDHFHVFFYVAKKKNKNKHWRAHTSKNEWNLHEI